MGPRPWIQPAPCRAALSLLLLAACGPATPEPQAPRSATSPTAAAAASTASIPPPALLDPGDGPSLFLGPEEDAPAIGYTGRGLSVEPAEPPRLGRVLVRIEGPMRVRAHAPVERLYHIVQRRGRIRGAPMYVGPGDHVHVLGPAEEPGRVRVVARARLDGGWSDSYGGTFPEVGLAQSEPPADTEPPRAGQPHRLPPGTTLTLHDSPGGSAVAGVPPQQAPVAVEVLRSKDGWRAVRVGHGPYLIGYTADALEPGEALPPPEPAAPPAAPGPVPARIQREQGVLKRVRAGAKLRFNDTIVAVFKEDGWARVLQEYPGGQVDVFAAANDEVAVRGLVDGSLLYDPPADAASASASQ